MIEHDRYPLSDIGRDASPRRARAKREGLGRVFTERRREQLQRFDVCIVHKFIFLASEIAELKTPTYTPLAVLAC